MNATRKDFLGGLAASFGFAGCQGISGFAAAPRLRFGVVSDVHLTTPASTAAFRRALGYFRRQGADAVVVPGDLSDWGLKSGFLELARAWREEMSETDIVPLFCTGNHDYEGWWYGDMTLDMHVQGYSEDEALVRLDMGKCWKEAFGEDFAPIRCRTVKGYSFVSAEWDKNVAGEAQTAAWLKAHAAELGNGKPFFFFRHEPIPGTVSSSPEEKTPSALKKALSAFPNAYAFTGHTHRTFFDEGSIWQGAFTAVSVPSLSYTSIPKGYENGSDRRRPETKLGMPRLPSRDNLEEPQGFLVSVYEDRLDIVRYDFGPMDEVAEPWSVPSGVRERPYAFAEHAKCLPVPQFSSDAAVRTYTTNADRRNGTWAIFLTLEFPTAGEGASRAYDYEVSAVLADGTVAATKRFLSPAYYLPPDREPESQRFRFDAMDLPEKGRYRLRVTPRNSFGAGGRPIWSEYRESFPGKDKTKFRNWND